MEPLTYANYPFMPTHENLTYDHNTDFISLFSSLPRDYGLLQI